MVTLEVGDSRTLASLLHGAVTSAMVYARSDGATLCGDPRDVESAYPVSCGF